MKPGRSVRVRANVAGETNKDAAQPEAAGCGTAGVPVSKLAAAVHREQPLLQETLQRRTPGEKRIIGGFLTATEAVRLMRASGDLYRAISTDNRLGFTHFSHEMQRVMHEHPAPDLGALQTPLASGHRSFSLKRLFVRRTKDGCRAGRIEVDMRHERESAIEQTVFHFASQRLHASQYSACASTTEFGALNEAISNGNVELVHAGLREFLALPGHLFPGDRKLAWLREANGMCLLEFFGHSPCDVEQPAEQRRYEAIVAYVDEIVSSQYLTTQDKAQLCVKLELFRFDDESAAEKFVQREMVSYAMSHRNPAVAASILIGIHQSSADARVKRVLLEAAAQSWRSLAECVMAVSTALAPHAVRQPGWVDGVRARLHGIVVTSPSQAAT
jgi:hypothetical protein